MSVSGTVWNMQKSTIIVIVNTKTMTAHDRSILSRVFIYENTIFPVNLNVYVVSVGNAVDKLTLT